MEKFIGFIPARMGSKRIPNKNLKLFRKKPLIFYSIDASKKSKYISETVVFSNSKKINIEAKKYDAITSYKRPNKVSKNSTTMFGTLDYFIKKNNIQDNFDYLVLLQPTSPLRNTRDINKACKMVLQNKKADGLISTFFVKKVKKNHPNKFMIEKNNFLKEIDKKKASLRKEKLFLRNGPSIFIIKINRIKKNLYKNKLLNFIMPESRSIDINTLNDLNKLRKI